MNTNISPILQSFLVTVIEVLLPIALAFLVKWLNSKIAEVKGAVNAQDLQFAVGLIGELVHAAEQNGLTGALAAEGNAKKTFVLDQAKAELDRRNIKIDVDLLDSLIEGAVHASFGNLDNPLK